MTTVAASIFAIWLFILQILAMGFFLAIGFQLGRSVVMLISEKFNIKFMHPSFT